MTIARPTWFKVGISLVFWSSWFVIVFASDTRTLQKIEVYPLEGSDYIHLVFDKKYLNEPIINFESGSLRLYLDSVKKGSQVHTNISSKGNSLVKGVRTIQVPGKNFTLLDIKYGSGLSLDPPEIKHSDKSLILILRRSFTNTPILSINKVLMDEIEQRVKMDSTLFSSVSSIPHSESISDEVKNISPLQMDNWGETILTLVLSLIFVLLLIYFIAYLYKRFFSSHFSSIKGKINIRQISSYYVGPKQKVIVFDFNGRYFACGVTPSSINLIAEVYDENEIGSLNSKNENEDDLVGGRDKTGSNFQKTLDPEIKKINKNELENQLSNPNNNTKSRISSKKKLKKVSSKNITINSGNKIIIDFASKLTKKIKLLKPIK